MFKSLTLTRKQKKKLYRIIAATFFAIASAIIPGGGYIKLMIFLASYLIVGYEVLYKAGRNIVHGDVFDEQFLMAVATLGALCVGEYPEACAVMIFYQIGELFESIAVGKSRKSISKLMDIRPDYANVIRDGKEQQLTPDEVNIGDIIVIKPGERVPLDGVIVSGNTTLNTAALTGESVPMDAAVGDEIVSGSVNLTGAVNVEVKRTYSQSTVSRILELVENASDKKARIEGFITRFARFYTPIVVIAALLLAVIPPLLIGYNSWTVWSGWIHRALVFLVVSCPCALVVSVPLAFFGGIGGASKEGILIKGSNYMELLSKVDTVVFDKTGTLTKGVFEVEAVHTDKVSSDKLIDIAATAESLSNHPIAQSIIRDHGNHINNSQITDTEEIAGKGIKAVIDGKTYYVGNSALMEMAGAQAHQCHRVGTIIHISENSDYLGHIVLNDELKESSVNAVVNLNKLNIKTVMLTGDKSEIASEVANKLGISKVYSELLPADKVGKVEELLQDKSRYGSLAFVGDGINDAPVLMRSDVGISMGAMGSDAAIEASDVVLMNDDPRSLVLCIKLSQKTMRIVHENIVAALAVKVLVLILGALGIANMWIAVFGDVGVLILAILNSLRAFRIKH